MPLALLTSPAVVTASASTRTVTGIVAVYDVLGSASLGPMIIHAGGLTLAQQLGRVKLLVDHDQAQPVGFGAAATDTPKRLSMTFSVPPGQAGDQALIQAANGLRDGLSVGLWIEDGGFTWDDDDVLHVSAAQVREVSLCALPAYDDARVTDVAASAAAWRAASAAGTRGTTTMPAPVIEDAAPVAVTATATPDPAPPSRDVVVVATQAAPVDPPRATSRRMTLAQASDRALELIRAGQPQLVQAALADIVPADDAGRADQPQWVAELWQASEANRPLIDALGTPRPLTALKVMGYSRVYTQLVDEYAGNKTDIFSGDYTTAPAEAPAQRFAGGNDIDRAFFDLGDGSFIRDWFVAATDDYKRQTEDYVAAALLAAALAVTGQTSVIGSLNTIAANLKGIGANLDFAVLSPGAWGELSSVTTADAPWWLSGSSSVSLKGQDGSVNDITVVVSPALTGLQVLGGDTRAATFYEKNPPVQVTAVEVGRAGIDVGVFGYIALLVNDGRALQKATYVPVPPVAGATTAPAKKS
jgi:HK97 family phage prohead protease